RAYLNGYETDIEQKWDLQNLIIELLSYTEKYIQDKESTMEGADDAQLAKFRSFNEEFSADIIAFNKRAVAQSGSEDKLVLLDDVQKFIGNWLLQNLMRDEDSFTEYFKEKDVAAVAKPSENKPVESAPVIVDQDEEEPAPVIADQVEKELEKVATQIEEPNKIEPQVVENESEDIESTKPAAIEPETLEQETTKPDSEKQETKEPDSEELQAPEIVNLKEESNQPEAPEQNNVDIEEAQPIEPDSSKVDSDAHWDDFEEESVDTKPKEADIAELNDLEPEPEDLVGEITTSKDNDNWEWEQKLLAEQALDDQNKVIDKPAPLPEPESRNNNVFIGVVIVSLLGAGYLLWQPSNEVKKVDKIETQPKQTLAKEVIKKPDTAMDMQKDEDVTVVNLAPKEILTKLTDIKPEPQKQVVDNRKVQDITEPQPVIQKEKPVILPTAKKEIINTAISQSTSIPMNFDSEGIPRGPDPEYKKGYFISMGCFSKKLFAVGQVKRVMKLSLPVYMKSIRGDTLHCVFGGPFATKSSAQEAAELSHKEANVENTTIKSY
ncbi:MAG: hypothetical protein HQL71_13985, partial [Magnetococcales bacterium]|nr:hypothetical protein [Magnetococcales bacterium]